MGNMTQAQGWHTAEWGLWGWVETILKLVALGAGILAFVDSDAAAPLMIGDNPHPIALALIALLALGALGQLGIRFAQREVSSFVFAILNLLGHVGLLIAVLRIPDQPALSLVFGGFYALGQIVKVQFLRVTGYTEGGATPAAMQIIAVVEGVLYAAFAILMLF
ncbi:MAG: hypothetical protein IT319_20910 [Anaerolineae bacterium]|nr:hypothetical protein [Anaerolineae bacterium]